MLILLALGFRCPLKFDYKFILKWVFFSFTTFFPPPYFLVSFLYSFFSVQQFYGFFLFPHVLNKNCIGILRLLSVMMRVLHIPLKVRRWIDYLYISRNEAFSVSSCLPRVMTCQKSQFLSVIFKYFVYINFIF